MRLRFGRCAHNHLQPPDRRQPLLRPDPPRRLNWLRRGYLTVTGRLGQETDQKAAGTPETIARRLSYPTRLDPSHAALAIASTAAHITMAVRQAVPARVGLR